MSDIEKETLDLYERMKELYKLDPEEFEREKQRIINEYIGGMPEEHQQDAKGFQFQIDGEMAKEKDPISKMNRMVELFWMQVGEFNTACTNPSQLLEERKEKENKDGGDVVPFKGPQKD